MLFNLIANPVSGKIYASNTDSQNHVRFEGPGTIAAGVKPMGEPATTARANGTLHRLEHSWPRWLRRYVGPPITGHIRLSGILVEPKGSEG